MKTRVKGLLERKLEDAGRRKRFEDAYSSFQLEVQILNAMEKKGWTFADLAQALGTHKSNISRDLSAGRINSATVSRLVRIGAVLGLQFLPLFVPKQAGKDIVPKIQQLVSIHMPRKGP